MGIVGRPPLLAVLGVAVVGLVVMLVVSRSGTEGLTFETVTATRGDLAHEVSVTGRVEPAERVTLAFETVGRVERVQATEGERVEAGQTLAALDTDMLRARRREVEADLAREQASLAELLAGARSEDVAVAEAQLAQAQAARASAERDLAEFFERSYRRALDEVRTYADQLFDDDTDEPDFGIELSAGGATYYIRADREVVLRLEELRDELNERFADWRALVRAGTTSDTAAGAQAVREHLGAVGDFLGELGGVVSAYRPRDTTEQTLYDNFKLDVLSAQSAIVALASELQRTREALEAAAAAVAVAQQERTRAARGARPESVAVAEAQVKRVEAALASVDAELDRAFLIAPLSGIVTDVAIDAGEVVSPGSGAVSLISDGAYEIVAFIPEADIAEVRVGNEAELTLDAFERSRLFSAEVVDIAPAETILDGVPTYETTLAFSDPADDIRSGMTAEIDLLTSKREDVVMIPARAIERDGSRTYVRVPREDAEEGAESFREVDVVTGVRGGGGMIEIREGLAAGETVVLFIEE